MFHATQSAIKTVQPYLIPIVPLNKHQIDPLLEKIADFNEIIQLVIKRLPIYQVNNFIHNRNQPHLHRMLRNDFMHLLEVLFQQPESNWQSPNPRITSTIQSLQNYFKPFKQQTHLLFDSNPYMNQWASLREPGNHIPLVFFECTRILFGIHCVIPETGTQENLDAILTANLTNHGSHFSIGNQYLLTPSDGDCFFHLICQFITMICTAQQHQFKPLNQLHDLIYPYAISQQNDNIIRFLHSIKQEADLTKLLKSLLEHYLHPTATIEASSIYEVTTHMIGDYFSVAFRIHAVNPNGFTYLKKTYGPESSPWIVDVFCTHDTWYIPGDRLGSWLPISHPFDLIKPIAKLWLPSLLHHNNLDTTSGFAIK